MVSPPTPITAVLFDFGMVLSGPPSPPVWQAMQHASGLSHDALHHAYWSLRDDYDRGALTGDAYWNAIAALAATTFDPVTRTRLIALDVDLWTDMNEPMVAWVRELHRAGIRTGILSNMPDSMAEGICAKFAWIGDFHHTVWSHALLLRKPDPAIYAAAIAGLGVPAAQILFLDDREDNIAAARTAGLQTLLYSSHDAFVLEMNARGFGHLLYPAPAALQTMSSR